MTPRAPDASQNGLAVAAGLHQQVRVLCRTSLNGLFLVDDARQFVLLNGPAARLLGGTAGDVVGLRVDDVTPPEHLSYLETLWDAFISRGRLSGVYELLGVDGVRRTVRFRATRRFEADRHLVAAAEAEGLEPRPTDPDAGAASLTAREREVLQLAAAGLRTSEMAQKLFLSPGTVKTHLHNTYMKLEAADRASAVAEAMRRGLIQ
jgi:PAS domain S-box-containing protein